MEHIHHIRYEYYEKEKSVREIAKSTGHDRGTVKKYVDQEDFNLPKNIVAFVPLFAKNVLMNVLCLMTIIALNVQRYTKAVLLNAIEWLECDFNHWIFKQEDLIILLSDYHEAKVLIRWIISMNI